MHRDPVDRPAPDDLELVRLFVNTRDLDKRTDELADVAGIERWLDRHGLRDGITSLTRRDVRRAIETREAFRAVLVANAGHGEAAQAVRLLNALADGCGVATRFTGPAAVATFAKRAHGIDVMLARLVAIAFEAAAEGRWSRLKACPSTTCHWAYYDRSRNRTSVWCDMNLCGNRAKRAARRRRADA